MHHFHRRLAFKATSFSSIFSRHPFLSFGLPFLATIVVGSFALTEFTQTRYDLSASRVKAIEKEELLGMKGKKPRSLQEEYLRLSAKIDTENWDQRRIERLPGYQK